MNEIKVTVKAKDKRPHFRLHYSPLLGWCMQKAIGRYAGMPVWGQERMHGNRQTIGQRFTSWHVKPQYAIYEAKDLPR